MWHGMHGRRCGGGRGKHDHWEQFAARFAFGWDEAQRGPGGRQRRMFDGGELRLVLLRLIEGEPRHGYDLIREIEGMTGGAYAPSPGVVYPTLTLLDEMGLIAEQASEGAKKRYAITEEGRRHLDERRAEADALMARLAQLGVERSRGDRASVRRAMGNLRVALQDRLGRGDLSQDTLHDVAALIDEVAQKIERLR